MQSSSLSRCIDGRRTTAPGPLLALPLTGFVTILTEALPAGLLHEMGAGLGVSEARVGKSVTAWHLAIAGGGIVTAFAAQRHGFPTRLGDPA